MSTAGRAARETTPDASDIAATLRDAEFVQVVARADGAPIAASGLVARACSDAGIPFQVSVARPDAIADRVAAVDDDSLPVVVGASVPTDGVTLTDSTSALAFETARELGGSPDPVLALAGVVADGRLPGEDDSAAVLDAVAERVERRPGVAVPTADLADGLAHTTLAHADFSGDKGAVQAELAELGLPVELDERAHRTVASLLALATTGPEEATPRAGEAVERVLRPYAIADGRFATVGGYADVLNAVAWERPGTGVALALGHDARADALDAWRNHSQAAHAALHGATTGRYDGLFVARTDDGPVETTARLLRDFRSPEPVALVVSDDEAAAASTDDRALGDAMEAAAASVNGTGGGSARRGYARFERVRESDGDSRTRQNSSSSGADTKEFITAFREALA